MGKRLLSLVLSLVLLAGCAQRPPREDAQTLRILCTTYPVYLFAAAVAQGAEGVEVRLLVNSQTSCLHDYTLTVNDMKAIEAADVVVMNGAGLEDFMAAALAQTDAQVIDCSQGVDLLPTPEHAGHDGHDHEEEYDPHIWMDPARAAVMVENIANGLSAVDEGNADAYRTHAAAAQDTLTSCFQGWPPEFAHIGCQKLITFHDGFQYFAQAFGLDLLKSVEEDEGAEAGAKELEEIIGLVNTHHIPAIFVETNGSRRSADVIARETGCQVYELDMLMSGTTADVDLQGYIGPMYRNLQIIVTVLNGQEFHEMEGL